MILGHPFAIQLSGRLNQENVSVLLCILRQGEGESYANYGNEYLIGYLPYTHFRCN